MAVFHTPIVSISSTALTTLLAPTKPKSSNLASLPISGCVIPRSLSKIPSLFLLRATPLQKYVYPDPIPEFAVYVLFFNIYLLGTYCKHKHKVIASSFCARWQETKKFREELKKKLYKERDTFGDDLDKVVDTCTEVILNFIHVGGYLRYFSWWSWPHCKSDVEFLMMPTSCSMKCLIKNAPCMPYVSKFLILIGTFHLIVGFLIMKYYKFVINIT